MTPATRWADGFDEHAHDRKALQHALLGRTDGGGTAALDDRVCTATGTTVGPDGEGA